VEERGIREGKKNLGRWSRGGKDVPWVMGLNKNIERDESHGKKAKVHFKGKRRVGQVGKGDTRRSRGLGKWLRKGLTGTIQEEAM